MVRVRLHQNAAKRVLTEFALLNTVLSYRVLTAHLVVAGALYTYTLIARFDH